MALKHSLVLVAGGSFLLAYSNASLIEFLLVIALVDTSVNLCSMLHSATTEYYSAARVAGFTVCSVN